MKIQLQTMAKKPFLVMLSRTNLHRLKLETVSDSSQTSLREPHTKFPQSQGRHLSRITIKIHVLQYLPCCDYQASKPSVNL